MNPQNSQIGVKRELTALYFKAKSELRSMEYNLSKHFSPTLLNNCYQVKQLTTDLEKILGTEVTQIP